MCPPVELVFGAVVVFGSIERGIEKVQMRGIDGGLLPLVCDLGLSAVDLERGRFRVDAVDTGLGKANLV